MECHGECCVVAPSCCVWLSSERIATLHSAANCGMPGGGRDNNATYTPDEFVVALEKIDNVRQQQGVCVACITDCDCAVHEFCGYDFDEKYEKNSNEWTYEYKVKIPSGITSTNEGGGMPKIAKQELELYAMQYEGLPMKSTCKKYSTSHVKKGPKVCDAKIGMSFFAKMVEESLLSGAFRDVLRTCDIKNGSESQGSRTRVKRTPSKWPKEARGSNLRCNTKIDETCLSYFSRENNAVRLS